MCIYNIRSIIDTSYQKQVRIATNGKHYHVGRIVTEFAKASSPVNQFVFIRRLDLKLKNNFALIWARGNTSSTIMEFINRSIY